MAETRNTFVNVDFKNDLELLDWLEEAVKNTPDTDRSKFIRRLVRREMRRDLRRKEQQEMEEREFVR
jgi:hypothetical protein